MELPRAFNLVSLAIRERGWRKRIRGGRILRLPVLGGGSNIYNKTRTQILRFEDFAQDDKINLFAQCLARAMEVEILFPLRSGIKIATYSAVPIPRGTRPKG